MENLYKIILESMTLSYFNSYRLLVTENVIELKLIPKNDKDLEVNYSMKNTEYNIGFLTSQLQVDFEKYI